MKLFSLKIKKHLPILLVSLFFCSLVLLFFAQPTQAKWGVEFFGNAQEKGLFVRLPAEGAAGIIVNIVMWMMSIIALLALAFIVYGAIKYVTSAGNEKQIEEAKRILLYAIIGLVIAILAVVIIQLVARVVERGEVECRTDADCGTNNYCCRTQDSETCWCQSDRCLGPTLRSCEW